MEIKFRHLLLLTIFFFSGLNSYQQDSTVSLDPMYDIDSESLSFIKNELIITKNVLINIRDGQNPAIGKKIFSAFGNLLKELLYVGSAVAIGGGCVIGGIALLVGPQNISTMLENSLAQGAVFIALPPLIVSIIITYTFLKLIFDHILSSRDMFAVNIKENLLSLEQIINKLNYTIKKIERLDNPPQRFQFLNK